MRGLTVFVGVLCLLLAAVLFSPQSARQPPGVTPAAITELMFRLDALDMKTERVVDLPEDGDVWHTIAVYDSNAKADADSRKLAANLAATPRLQSLVAQTKFHEYSRNDLWVKRWHPNMATPALLVMTHQGRMIYKASGSNLPAEGERLASEIQYNIGRLYPNVASRGDCSPDGCGPFRPNAPNHTPEQGKIPDLRPDGGQTPLGGMDETTLVVLAVVAGGVLLLFYLQSQKK